MLGPLAAASKIGLFVLQRRVYDAAVNVPVHTDLVSDDLLHDVLKRGEHEIVCRTTICREQNCRRDDLPRREVIKSPTPAHIPHDSSHHDGVALGSDLTFLRVQRMFPLFGEHGPGVTG